MNKLTYPLKHSSLTRRDFLKFLPSFFLAQFRLAEAKKSGSITPAPDHEKEAVPNVIILVFDALSACNMSIFGYNRQTTPNMNRFAENATVFHRHYSAGSFTPSGTASLLTGVYPWSHRSLHSRGRPKDEYAQKNIFGITSDNFYKLAYTHNNLAGQLLDLFKAQIDSIPKAEVTGLTTGAVSESAFWNDFNNAYRAEKTMFGYYHDLPSLLLSSIFLKFRNFINDRIIDEKYHEMFPVGVPQTGDFMYFLLEDSIDWIIEQVAQMPQPYLAYFHLWPPHEPLKPRVEFLDLFKDGWQPAEKEEHIFSQQYSNSSLLEARRFYDEYIAYVDAEFGRFYEIMKKKGLLDHIILILTSDHGDLFERGICGHVTPALFDPVIRIPLIISTPGQTNRDDIFIPTSSTDVVPTILALTGQMVPEWIEGKVLPPYYPGLYDQNIYAMDSKHISKNAPFNKGSFTLIRDRYKIVYYSGYEGIEDKYELYDLGNDPEELEDRFLVDVNIGKELKDVLSEKIKQVNVKSDRI